MDEAHRARIEELLYGLPFWEDAGKRQVFLAQLLRGHPIWRDIRLGSQAEAAKSLLTLCEEHALRLLHGKPPICALLQALGSEYAQGSEARGEIERRMAELCTVQGGRPRVSWKGEPYRGLAYFDRRHAPIFFGREGELRGLIDALGTEQGRRFLIVLGASGSGKSSLVRAGLWARLAAGDIPESPGSEGWLIAAMIPTEKGSPVAALADATARAVSEHDAYEDLLDFDWDQAVDDIAAGTDSLASLAGRLLEGRSGARWLLILDQMEELFTAVDEVQRDAFIEQLIDATKPPTKGDLPRFQVLGTLRADFFHHCVAHPSLRLVIEQKGGQFLLGPPERLSLERMVTGPLTDVDLLERDAHGNWVPVHWTLDSALAPAIAAEAAGREGGLALMAFALRELHERCKPFQHLDFLTYRSKDFGGLGGAIGRRADTALEALGAGFENALGPVFAHLVHVSGDEPPTRRHARLADWREGTRERRLVDAFVQARLLVTRGGEGETATVEVAHEALLREWPTLVEWIKDTREALRLRDRIEEEKRLWKAEGRPTVRLWRHELLDPARRLLAEAALLADLEGDPDTADFLTPEADWLLTELLCSQTNHARREAIGMRLSEIGDPRPGVGCRDDSVPDILWCELPGGKVEIERHGRRTVAPFHIAAYPEESEWHGRRTVAPFRIAAYPVTYAQYRAFLQAEDGYRSERWWGDLKHQPEPGQQLRPYTSYPADNVSWWDATAFCRWLGSRLGLEVRLPDEWEWQWAAQSACDGFAYPWGPDWLDGVANTDEAGIGRTTAVGMYPGGRSRQRVYDLAGNVWEWCRNEYADPGRIEPGGDDSRVSRGGSWGFGQGYARAVYREFIPPHDRGRHAGFRVVCVSPLR